MSKLYKLTPKGVQHATRAMMALMDADPSLSKVQAKYLIDGMAGTGALFSGPLQSDYFMVIGAPLDDPFEEIIERPYPPTGLVPVVPNVKVEEYPVDDIDTDPAPEPAPRKRSGMDFGSLTAALEDILGKVIDEDRVRQIAANEARKVAGVPTTVRIEIGLPIPVLTEGTYHAYMSAAAAAVLAGVNLLLVGPAGSGKTTAGKQIADMLNRRFFYSSCLDTGFKLTGFIDASSNYRRTAFREAYEHGGGFMLDEMDRCVPGAIMVLQSALANKWMDFPDGQIQRHPEFFIISGVNTWMRGQDREYVTANKQDAAALDRWTGLYWPYDPRIEAASVGLPAPRDSLPVFHPKAITCEDQMASVAQRWFDRVRAVRHGLEEAKVHHVVSPRATQTGVALLAAGWSWELAEEGCIWKGLEPASRQKAEVLAARWAAAN